MAACGDVAGARLLDVGCGAGYFARETAHLGARVMAVDISPRMIEHARHHEAMTPLGVEYRVAREVTESSRNLLRTLRRFHPPRSTLASSAA